MNNKDNYPNIVLKKQTSNLILKLKELELENKLLKEQLEKAFPVINLEKLNKRTYLQKKYGKLIWWIEFLIILCIKDISRWILYTYKIAPSDLLMKLFQIIKGCKANA